MKLELNQVWQHFKGAKYSIVAFSLGAEGDELVERVSYRKVPDLLTLAYEGGVEHLAAINSLPIYSRPVSNFLEEVDRPELDYKGPRFYIVGD